GYKKRCLHDLLSPPRLIDSQPNAITILRLKPSCVCVKNSKSERCVVMKSQVLIFGADGASRGAAIQCQPRASARGTLDSCRNSSPSGAAQQAWTLYRPSGTWSFSVLVPRAHARG